MWNRTHLHVGHDLSTREMCDMMHSYVGHDFFIGRTWLIRDTALALKYIAMTRSYVGHDSFLRETRLISTWNTTHFYVWHESVMCETWLMHMCGDMSQGRTHSRPRVVVETRKVDMWEVTCGTWHVGHDSFVCRDMSQVQTHRRPRRVLIQWLIQMWDVTHLYVRTCHRGEYVLDQWGY